MNQLNKYSIQINIGLYTHNSTIMFYATSYCIFNACVLNIISIVGIVMRTSNLNNVDIFWKFNSYTQFMFIYD